MEYIELGQREAVDAVSASARKLFPLVSEQQARDLASLVLRELDRQGIQLMRRCDRANEAASA